MRPALLGMARTRSMTALTTEGPDTTAEPFMVVRVTGIAVMGMPMARGARQPGTTARVAPQDGVGAPRHGIMDREISAVSEAVRRRGVAAMGARGDGAAARSPGAADPGLSMELTVAQGDGDGDEII